MKNRAVYTADVFSGTLSVIDTATNTEIAAPLVATRFAFPNPAGTKVYGIGYGLNEVSIVDDLSSGRRENVSSRARFYQVDVQAVEIADAVGCGSVGLWPGADGWDYNFEADYGDLLNWFIVKEGRNTPGGFERWYLSRTRRAESKGVAWPASCRA